MHPTLRLALALIAGIAAALITIMVIETVGHSMYPPPALDYNDTEALRAYVDGLPLGAKLIVLSCQLAAPSRRSSRAAWPGCVIVSTSLS